MVIRRVEPNEPEITSRIGGSFHNATFNASVDELTTLFGEENIGASADDKTKHEWFMLIRDSKTRMFFHIYDWKEYRDYPSDEIVTWHIGSKYGENEDEIFAMVIRKMLRDLRNGER